MAFILVLLLIFSTHFLEQTAADCPEGSIRGLTSDDCYLYRSSAPWFDAEEDCVAFGGHLTSVHDGFTNAFLLRLPKQILQPVYGRSFWIGGSVGTDSTDKWTWSDGTPFTYSNWEKGHPFHNGTYCAAIAVSTERWYSDDCSTPAPYICKVPSNGSRQPYTKEPAQPSCPGRCPSGWTYFNVTNFCYKTFHDAYTTWPQAQKTCLASGAHLVSIHSYQEHMFVQEISATGVPMNWVAGAYDAGVWIGFSDAAQRLKFEWTDGTPMDFSYWASERPTAGYPSTSCGDFYPDYFTGQTANEFFNHWDNLDCNGFSLRAFVCKQSAGTVV